MFHRSKGQGRLFENKKKTLKTLSLYYALCVRSVTWSACITVWGQCSKGRRGGRVCVCVGGGGENKSDLCSAAPCCPGNRCWDSLPFFPIFFSSLSMSVPPPTASLPPRPATCPPSLLFPFPFPIPIYCSHLTMSQARTTHLPLFCPSRMESLPYQGQPAPSYCSQRVPGDFVHSCHPRPGSFL